MERKICESEEPLKAHGRLKNNKYDQANGCNSSLNATHEAFISAFHPLEVLLKTTDILENYGIFNLSMDQEKQKKTF